MVKHLWHLGGLALMLVAAEGRAQPSAFQQVHSILEQWVQTQQLLSKTRADWQAETQTLQQTLAMFEGELKSLAAQLGQVDTNRTQVAFERTAVEKQKAALEAARELLASRLGAIEAKVRQLSPAFPEPLRKTVQPLLDRLPAPDSTTGAENAPRRPPRQRLQTVVTLLNEVGKFNATVTLSTELRPTADGTQVKVQVLYFGLGQAWYTDETGQVAGRGVPQADGWHWSSEPALADAIRSLIAKYEEKQPAAFVALPVEIR